MVIFNSYVKLPEGKPSSYWGIPIDGTPHLTLSTKKGVGRRVLPCIAHVQTSRGNRTAQCERLCEHDERGSKPNACG